MNGDRVDAMDSSRDGGMRCNRLLWLCILCFWFVLTQWGANWPHLTHQPWFLVSNFAIRKLVLIYIHKKETKDSQCSSCSPFLLFVMFCLAPSVMFSFCHVLFGAISIITRAGTRAHVHLFFSRFLAIQARTTQKTWRDTSTSSIHHDEWSLLLWWMWEQTH